MYRVNSEAFFFGKGSDVDGRNKKVLEDFSFMHP